MAVSTPNTATKTTTAPVKKPAAPITAPKTQAAVPKAPVPKALVKPANVSDFVYPTEIVLPYTLAKGEVFVDKTAKPAAPAKVVTPVKPASPTTAPKPVVKPVAPTAKK